MKQGYIFFCYDVLMIFFVQSYLGLKILKGSDFVTGHGIIFENCFFKYTSKTTDS